MSSSDKKGDDIQENCLDVAKDDDLGVTCELPVLDSEQLFQGSKMIRIRHGDVVYILRET